MKKYLHFVKIGFQVSFTYRTKIWLRAVRHTVVAMTLILLWFTLFRSGQSFFGYNISAIITYYVMVEIIDTLYTQTPGRLITKDINSGDLSSFLIKPASYWNYVFSYTIGQQIGGNLPSLLFVVAAFIIFPNYFVMPEQLANQLFFVVSIVIAFLLYFQIFFVVGVLTFFMSQTTFLRQGVNQISSVFGGKWVPLAMIPAHTLPIFSLLPFQFLYDFPVKIFQEKIVGLQMYSAMLTMFIWLVALLFLGKWLWTEGVKKYEAYGK